MSATRLRRHAAPCAAAGLACCLAAGACREAPATAERIIFSSTRDGLDGSRHLWMVAPDDPASLAQLTTGRAIDIGPALSPDGTLVAFARATPVGSARFRIWIRSLPDGGEWPVTTDPPEIDAVDLDPFWAPDGRTLGFSRSGGGARPHGARVQTLWRVRIDRSAGGIDAGAPVRMASDVGGIRFHGSWNPVTGSDVLFCRFVGGYAPYTVWRLDLPGGTEREVVPHGCCGNYHPAYAPDGRRFTYRGLEYSEHGGDVFVTSADGTGTTRVSCESGWASPAWSPDGTDLVAQRLTAPPGLWRFPVPAAGGPCAAPVQVTSGAYQDTDPAWGLVRLR